jgi:hypothetical protein
MGRPLNWRRGWGGREDEGREEHCCCDSQLPQELYPEEPPHITSCLL